MPTAKVFLVNKKEDGSASYEIIDKDFNAPENNGDVLVKVLYSSVNYKDCLSSTIHHGITRSYPHIPGIDAAGIVHSSKSDKFKIGDEVIITGYDLGMNSNGGWAEYVLAPQEWIVKKPKNLSLKDAMIFGTAGFTAMSAIHKITPTLNSKSDKILITGATGGVGSLASLILQERGYYTCCLTRKESDFIKELAPNEIILTDNFIEGSNKPLLSREYQAAIDNLGGNITAEIIKRINYHGGVALCGNILGNNLESSLFPFILRGISIFGISSANTQMQERIEIWEQIAQSNITKQNKFLFSEISLADLPQIINKIKSGQNQGRIILNLS